MIQEHEVVVINTPVNDTCQGAVPFNAPVGMTSSNTGDGTDATVDGPSWPAAQVWEAFILDECADVVIDFCGSDPYAAALYINIYNACPTDSSDAIPNGVTSDIECAPGDTAIQVAFTGLEAGTYYYPVVADEGFGGFEEYTINVTPTACAGEPDTCDVFLGGPWTNFNTEFGGAPVADPETGECPFNEITAFEVWASESYTIDGFVEGETYTFSICNGAYGAWPAELSVIDDQGNIILILEDTCSITWTAEYSGTYLVGINEVGACGSASDNTATDNGFPALTCEGTVGIEEVEAINFSVYPNPNEGQFSIMNEGVDGNFLIELMDVTGKIVHSERMQLNSSQRTDINTTDVTPGVYLLKMTNTEENYFKTIRMVVK